MSRPLPRAGERNLWYHQSESKTCIVFVHGLFSDCRDCWLVEPVPPMQPCRYWPEIAVTDPELGDPSVYLAGYPTKLTGPGCGVRECAGEVFAALATPSGPRRASVLDYPAILFVCHSAGGVVVRYLLETNHHHFRDKRVYLLLLGSPSVGSLYANVLSGLALIVGNQLAQELRHVSPILADLDGRFKTLIRERRIPQLYGQEAYEHLSLRRLPLRNAFGRIVSKESAGRYFGEPTLIGDTDHSSISKPTSRRHRSHSLLRDAARWLSPHTSTTPARFAHLSNYRDFIRVLNNRFDFRWESGTLRQEGTPSVYWPVRLRHPTAIHAVQCFAAAALQRLGCSVSLWIDDFGNPAYQIDEFTKQLRLWFEHCSGDASTLRVTRFSKGLHDKDSAIWDKVRAWLGTTEYRFGKVLPVCKLSGHTGGPEPLEQLLGRRPRRLLTPAMVWAAMEMYAESESATQVLTLSGHDERPLWQAWRECSGSSRFTTGHLFVPELLSRSSTGEDRPLYMVDNPLVWNSRTDIEATIAEECRSVSRVDLLEPGRLIPWCLIGCVLLPRFIRDATHPLVIGAVDIVAIADLPDVPLEQLREGLARALEETLL